MTPQAILDKVSGHLRTQGVRAMSSNSASCVYLNGQGHKCAVGCLIPEEVYDPNMVGSVTTLLARFRDVLPEYFYEHRVLLSSLQSVHDYTGHWRHGAGRFSEQGEARLRRVAQHFDLVYTPPEAP